MRLTQEKLMKRDHYLKSYSKSKFYDIFLLLRKDTLNKKVLAEIVTLIRKYGVSLVLYIIISIDCLKGAISCFPILKYLLCSVSQTYVFFLSKPEYIE